MSLIVTTMEASSRQRLRKGGRPLSFDRDVALRKAMLLFWRHGYEGTSIQQLTAALGVTPPSIYTAFGDKKRLFLEAVELYRSGEMTAERIIDEAATARDAARALMSGAAIGFTGSDTPSGCLMATSAISCSDDAADIQAELAGIRRGIEAHLRQRISRAVDSGELPPEADAKALAGLVLTVIQGMSTLARDGATRAELLGVADAAMTGWPRPG